MGGLAEHPDFFGVLGRVTTGEGEAELRLHPLVFSTTPGAKCVFVVRLAGAAFQEKDLAARVGEELEVRVFPDRAEILDPFDGSPPTVLRAAAVVAEWSAYDAGDFIACAGRLGDQCEQLVLALAEAVRKDRKGLALTRDLLRRAEADAAGSDGAGAGQTAAIDALRQLLRHFETRQ